MNKIFIIFFTTLCSVFSAQNAPISGQISLNDRSVSCPIFPLNISGSFINPASMTLKNNEIILEVRDAINPSTNLISTVANPTIFENDFYFNVDSNDLFPNNAAPTNKNFKFIAKATFKGTDNSETTLNSQINIAPDVIINGCTICSTCGVLPETYYIDLNGWCNASQIEGSCSFLQDINFSTILGVSTGTYKIYNVYAGAPDSRNWVSISSNGNTLPINTPSTCSIAWDWENSSIPIPTAMKADIEYTDENGSKTISHLHFEPIVTETY